MTEALRTGIVLLNTSVLFLACVAVGLRRWLRRATCQRVPLWRDAIIYLGGSDAVLSVAVACGVYVHIGDPVNWRIIALAVGGVMNCVGLALLVRAEVLEVMHPYIKGS